MWIVGLLSAWACDAPYTLDAAVGDLSATEAALRDGDAASGEHAARLESGLACLDAPLNPGLAARLYRAVGAGLEGAREGSGRSWMQTAYALDQGFVFGMQDLPEDSRVRDVWSDVQSDIPDPVPLSARELAEGLYKLDGRSLSVPAATSDRPHVLQREKDGVWTSWVVEGNAFPPEVLVDARTEKTDEGKTKQKRCKKGIRFKSFIASDGTYCPATPAEQLIISSSGPIALAAAGGLYAESWRQFQATRDATSVPDMEKHRRINNRLVAASGAVGVVGVGLSVFGLTYTGSF